MLLVKGSNSKNVARYFLDTFLIINIQKNKEDDFFLFLQNNIIQV